MDNYILNPITLGNSDLVEEKITTFDSISDENELLQIYLKEIGKIKLLKREREIEIGKKIKSKIGRLLDFVRPEPTCSPIGVIATSAPSVKRPIPKIKNKAQTLNIIISVKDKLSSGVKLRITTIKVTGKTENNASLILLINRFFIVLRIIFCYHINYII